MFCLITLLVTLQWQPSLASFLLGHNFDRLIREWKHMQHLEICLPSDLPTTEAYFSFQLTFKFRVLILPTQNGPQLLSNFFFSFSKLNLSLGFRGRKCRKRIHWWLSLWQTNDNEKPSAIGLFTKGQNLVADGQTSKMPSTTSGAGQIETNFGKQ